MPSIDNFYVSKEAGIEEDDKSRIKVIVKAGQILKCFSKSKPALSIPELVSLTGYNKTTVRRILYSLETSGFVEKVSEKRFQLSLLLFQMGSVVLGRFDLRAVARPVMTELSSRLQKTIYLFIKNGCTATCIDICEPNTPILIKQFSVGESLPLHVGGGPFSMLAFSSEKCVNETVDAINASSAVQVNMHERNFMERLNFTREFGYSVSVEDVLPGVAAVGSPIFNQNNEIIGAIGIGGVVSDFQDNSIHEYGQAVLTGSREISANLGYSGET